MFVIIKTLLFMLALQVVAVGVFRWALKPSLRPMVGTMDVALLMAIPLVGLFGEDRWTLYAFVLIAALTAVGSAEKLVVRFMLLLLCFPAMGRKVLIGDVYLGDADAVEFFALGALIVMLGVGRRKGSVTPALTLAAWAMFIGHLFLTVRGVPLNGVFREIPSIFLRMMIPFYLTATLLTTRSLATNAALAFVWGGLCNAAVAIFESVRHWLLYQSFYVQLHGRESLGVSATMSVRAGLLRAHGIVFDYECLGLLTALALITATAHRSRFSAAGFWVVALTLTGGCLASQARGGWIAAILGLVALAVYERRWRMIGIIGAAAAPLLVMIKILGASHDRFAQFIGSSGHGQQTIDYRSTLLSRGMDELFRHPWTGQTRDQLDVSMNDLRQSQHIIDFVNVHLNIALVGGFPLLAMWALAFLTPIYLIWRARPRFSVSDGSPPLGLPLAMVLASAVFIAGTSLTDRIVSLIMLGFGLTGSYLRLNAAPTSGVTRVPRLSPTRKPLVQPLPA